MNRKQRRAAKSQGDPGRSATGGRSSSQVAERLATALSHHQAGRLAEAESLYRQILAIEPDHVDSLHYLGVLAGQLGRHDTAIDLIGRALRVAPDYAEAHFNLGNILAQANRLEQAAASYQRMLALKPASAEAHYSLGIVLLEQDRLAQAMASFERATALKPDFVEAFYNQGLILTRQKRLEEAVRRFERALALRPSFAELHNSLGTVLSEQGKSAQAMACFERALALKPGLVEALYNQGLLLTRENRLAEAATRFERALTLKPDYCEAHYGLGNVLRAQGRLDEAVLRYGRALALAPNRAELHNSLGTALWDQGKSTEAMACFRRALALKPDFAGAHNGLGAVLAAAMDPGLAQPGAHSMLAPAGGPVNEAVACFERALALEPDFAEAHSNLGSAFIRQGRLDEAMARFERALALKPDIAEALNGHGIVLLDRKHPAAALADFDGALAIKPHYADALHNRGLALRELKRPAEALASFDQALAIKPNGAETLCHRGSALHELRRPAEALASCDRALAIKPDLADAHYNRALALRDLNRPAEALASFDRTLAIEPDNRYALGGAAEAALLVCDWARAARIAEELESQIRQRRSIIVPFTLLGYGSDPSLQLECAREFISNSALAPDRAPWKKEIRRHEKIRIAYLSADFRQHAVAFLLAELIELHDRARFEVVGISFGDDDHGPMRARLARAFDQFHDVRGKSDLEVAKLVNDLQVDIAIDLNAHTQGGRLGVFAYRPAAVQASYLGYASTTGAEFIDYVIADETVLPFDQQPFYTEKIVHLPDSFLVSDATRTISSLLPARRDAGLPDEGFVFCSFNNNYKIMPSVFDVWMRLMKGVEGSVLWLSRANDEAMANLRRQAAAREVDPARLIFAPKVAALEDHLARHRLADLFLDTLPYNAHSTANDALWAGLPLLTCKGASFASRVAASLLYAAGLPELVTSDLHEYEALALRLATDASLLRGFRQRLEENRATCPLFDSDRFRRHIESAYTTMWEIEQRGESPRSFSVEPGDGAREADRPL
jgi:protein O-GlcNAc transferase